MEAERNKEHLLAVTESLCPVCLQRIAAERVERNGRVFLKKTCPQHGSYEVCIWQGTPAYSAWTKGATDAAPDSCTTAVNKGCPFDCGLCPAHRQQTCCVLLEVTDRCNLRCPICFASAADYGADKEEPMLQVINEWYEHLLKSGGPYNIQLSGGEPTLRDDLPELIALGKKKGFSFFQVNTNGLRLAEDAAYVKRLKEAGLNCVFLQFDGLTEAVYEQLRGAPLLAVKKRAIDMCRWFGIGVVLVPTLVPGVNDGQIGELLQFAADNMPAVRGVHFQPISYLGRYPHLPQNEDRLLIPDILRAIEAQTKGKMRVDDFSPPSGEHAHCSFHGNFLVMADGRWQALRNNSQQCCGAAAPAGNGAVQARKFVARQWSAAFDRSKKDKTRVDAVGDVSSMDAFLDRAGAYTLAVSGMAFQDVWNLDLERLKQCFLHVMNRDGRLIPFCAYNLTADNGQALYRRTYGT